MVPLANTEVGKSLNSQKKHLRTENEVCALPQSQEFAMLMNKEVSFEEKVKFVEDFIANIGAIKAADGKMVNFNNPDYDGKGYSLKRRAEHLITESDKGDFRKRTFHDSRVSFVETMPSTVANADLVAEGKHYGQERTYYIKKYDQGTHLVVVDNKGNIIDQGDMAGLITQYPINLNNKFDPSFKITYKKGGSTSRAPSSI